MLRTRKSTRSRVDAIGPVQVLDHERERSHGADPIEEAQQQLEQLRLLDLARRCVARTGRQARKQAIEHGARGADQGVELLGAQVGAESAQGAHHGRVGQLAVRSLDAVSDEHARRAALLLVSELADQAALAHPGLARHEHGGRATGRRVRHGGLQRGKLRRAPHES